MPSHETLTRVHAAVLIAGAIVLLILFVRMLMSASAAPTPMPSPPGRSAPAPSAGVTGSASPAGVDPAILTSTRIVIFSPALAIIARDLGLTSAIVGRHAFDIALDPSIPSCGDQAGIDYETLAGLRPTHILMEDSVAGAPPRLSDIAGRRGWELSSFPLRTLADIQQAARRMHGQFVGPDSAWAAHPLHIKMQAAWSPRRPSLAPAGRVLLLAQLDPIAALGPGSYHHEMLERIGARPALTRGQPYTLLDAEDVLALSPDVIILIAPRPARTPTRAARGPEAATALGRLAGLDIPASAAARLALIDDPLSHTPSTAAADLADALAEHLAFWAAEAGAAPSAGAP